jgi:hypothetical protein
VDVLLGLCGLEARRGVELRGFVGGLDGEQIARDRHRLERETAAGADPAALEQVRQREARLREAEAGLASSRRRLDELEAALRSTASAPSAGAPEPSLAELLDGVDAVAAASEPQAVRPAWSALMQRTP